MEPKILCLVYQALYFDKIGNSTLYLVLVLLKPGLLLFRILQKSILNFSVENFGSLSIAILEIHFSSHSKSYTVESYFHDINYQLKISYLILLSFLVLKYVQVTPFIIIIFTYLVNSPSNLFLLEICSPT